MSDDIQAEEGQDEEELAHTQPRLLLHLAFQRLCGSYGSRTHVKSSKNILLRIDIPSAVGPEVSGLASCTAEAWEQERGCIPEQKSGTLGSCSTSSTPHLAVSVWNRWEAEDAGWNLVRTEAAPSFIQSGPSSSIPCHQRFCGDLCPERLYLGTSPIHAVSASNLGTG